MELVAVIEWLRGIEELAFQLYEKAAIKFKTQPELAAFLKRLAQDESWHFHLMGNAATLFKKRDDAPRSVIAVDEKTRSHVEGPLRAALARLEQPDVSIRALASGMMEAEFSEMNDIFLYVINSCQVYSKTFQHIASTIQEHEDRIAQFIGRLPGQVRPEQPARALPKIWKRRILVVEDEVVIRELWKRILSRCFSAEVLAVENGQEALDIIRESYVDLVISDVEMPVMKGGELYQRAIQEDARLKDRFIFCTGYVTDDIKALVTGSNVPLLEKPVAIHEMQEMIQKTLDQATRKPTEA